MSTSSENFLLESAQLKILLWPSSYLPNIGGIEVMTHTLALELQKNGHTVQVISGSSHLDDFAEYSLEKVPIATFPFTPALFSYHLSTIKKILAKITSLVETFSPDIVHVHGWFESFCFYQLRILHKNKLPLCISIHGLLEQPHYQTDACQKLWTRASAITTVSDALITALKEQGMQHPCLYTIHNGLPVPTLPIQPLPLDPPKLVMVGRLSEEKCFHIAFHALKILIQKYPYLTLCLVGGGAQYSELARLKSTLGLDAAIEMTDFVPPSCVIHYIDSATLVLVPSSYEAFGLIALQAALRGRPVIASKVCGLQEIVEHGLTGLLTCPQDPIALAAAIDHLLSHPGKIQSMGNAAKIRAERLFSIETTTQKYLAMYQKIQKPLVSIVIPAHNGEKYIREALESVLNQNYPNYEIWVIDNGSQDTTAQIAQSFPQVHYRNLKTADTAVARNEGIVLSHGEYIAFLDQDDTWIPEKLTKQVDFLESQKEYGAVIGLQKMYLEPGYEKPHWLKQEFLDKPQQGYLPSALMVRRATFQATHNFDTSFPGASDVAWFFKVQYQGVPLGMIDEVLVHRRIHRDNTSNKYQELQKEILGAIKASLVERRGHPCPKK